MKQLAVFISGGGSGLGALIGAEKAGRFGAAGRIALVVSSRADAYGLTRAREAGIPTAVFEKGDYGSAEVRDKAILRALTAAKIDCIALAGYLGFVTEVLLTAYPDKIINIHPSLIPAFCGQGFWGIKIHEAVLSYGAKVTGATVHFVDGAYDAGAVILQEAVPVLEGDTAESLQKRVLETEHKLLPLAVELLLKNKLKIEGRRVKIV